MVNCVYYLDCGYENLVEKFFVVGVKVEWV